MGASMILSSFKKVVNVILTPFRWVGELIVKAIIVWFVRAVWREYKNRPLKENQHDSVNV